MPRGDEKNWPKNVRVQSVTSTAVFYNSGADYLQLPLKYFVHQYVPYTVPVFLVHKQGVEKGTRLADNSIQRKQRVEQWDESNVFTVEREAYKCLVAKLQARNNEINQQITRINERKLK